VDSAIRSGRISVNSIRVGHARQTAALRSAAEDGLSRIRNAAGGDEFEALLFVPFGSTDDVLREVVVAVQDELRSAAIRRGCMIGVFYPGHPEPGVHSAAFRPLASPRAILGIRTMVDTDIRFLTAPGASATVRMHDVGVWQGFFAARAPQALLELGRQAMADAERMHGQ
jgi:hypothetical protein